MRCSPSLLAPGMVMAVCVAALAQAPTYNLGRTPSAEEIRTWDISINSEGKGLPPGSGTARQGVPIYAKKCASCHGPTGAEGEPPPKDRRRAPPLVGGQGTLKADHPVRTIGSLWPFATTIWDYTNRAMPLFEEGSLSPDEVYALTAFLLFRNGIIQETDVMEAQSLPKVQMPNRDGFVPPRPEWNPRETSPFRGSKP